MSNRFTNLVKQLEHATRVSNVSNYLEELLSPNLQDIAGMSKELVHGAIYAIVQDGVRCLEDHHEQVEWELASRRTVACFCLANYANSNIKPVNKVVLKASIAKKKRLYQAACEIAKDLDTASHSFVQHDDLRLTVLACSRLGLPCRASYFIGLTSGQTGHEEAVHPKACFPGYLEVSIYRPPTEAFEPFSISGLYDLIDIIQIGLGDRNVLSHSTFLEITAKLFAPNSAGYDFFLAYCQTTLALAKLPDELNSERLLIQLQQALNTFSGEGAFALPDQGERIALLSDDKAKDFGVFLASCRIGARDIRSLPEYGEIIDAAVFKYSLPEPLTPENDRELVMRYIADEYFSEQVLVKGYQQILGAGVSPLPESDHG